jgi:hypothetical protein
MGKTQTRLTSGLQDMRDTRDRAEAFNKKLEAMMTEQAEHYANITAAQTQLDQKFMKLMTKVELNTERLVVMQVLIDETWKLYRAVAPQIGMSKKRSRQPARSDTDTDSDYAASSDSEPKKLHQRTQKQAFRAQQDLIVARQLRGEVDVPATATISSSSPMDSTLPPQQTFEGEQLAITRGHDASMTGIVPVNNNITNALAAQSATTAFSQPSSSAPKP